MYNSVICSPFVEHPIVDVAQFDEGEYDIIVFEEEQSSNFINKGCFNKELYCKCLLHKLFTLTKSKINPFLQYQCEKMQEPIKWLNKFEKLIDLNQELFITKQQAKSFEKALTAIDIIRHDYEHQAYLPINRFDINQVKIKLKEYSIFEDKLSYLCEMETDYKQLRPVIHNSSIVPFDEQISLEIDKLSKQELLKEKSKLRCNIITNQVPLPKPQLKLNCNINYFVDVFYQLSQEKQAVSGSLKEIAEFIANGILDKDGNPISSDSVYTMLKPSNLDKRPKGNSRFKLE